MKALIVSESKDNAKLLETYARQAGYDTITYSWLLKALDNVEEISPHLVILSAVDYPRHWKTFVQYAQTCSQAVKPDIILFASNDFDESEIKKADCLGVLGYITGTDDAQLEKLNRLLHAQQPVPQEEPPVQTAEQTPAQPETASAAEAPASPAPDTAGAAQSGGTVNTEPAADFVTEDTVPAPDTCKLLFVHPKTGLFVTGKIVRFAPPSITFVPDQKSVLNLKNGTLITDASLKTAHGICSIQAVVVQNDQELTLSYEVLK